MKSLNIRQTEPNQDVYAVFLLNQFVGLPNID